MKISILSQLLVFTLLSSSLLTAESSSYIGIKVGSLSSDKSVYALEDDEEYHINTYIKYDDVSLLGLDFYSISRYENSLLIGLGVDLMLNKGNILEGGMLDIDFKLGAYYEDFSAYAIIGYGIQSLSNYTVAHGVYYGGAINYDLLESLAVKVEYRIHNLETTDNEDTTSSQSYVLSGVLAALAYKF